MENARQLKFSFIWDVLANLDLAALLSVEILLKKKRMVGHKDLPDAPVTYIIHTEQDGVVYVGATTSLYKRWPEHMNSWKIQRLIKSRKKVLVSWLPFDPRVDPEVEVFLISTYQPQMNCNRGGYPSKERSPRPKKQQRKARKVVKLRPRLQSILEDLSERGFTQAQIARKYGVSRQYVGQIYHNVSLFKRKAA